MLQNIMSVVFDEEGEDNTRTRELKCQSGRKKKPTPKERKNNRSPRPNKAASRLPTGSDRTIYGSQTIPQTSLSARAVGRVITGQTTEYDGMPQQCDASEENVEGGGDISFTWELRGENVTLPDVKIKNFLYKKRSSDELQSLRDEFNNTERKNFLKELGDTEDLKEAGFSENEINNIKIGKVPKGWQVHHKLPLDDSGTNEFDNLVLIQKEPYHIVLTNYQNSITRSIKTGETKKVRWPIPNGKIYPSRH